MSGLRRKKVREPERQRILHLLREGQSPPEVAREVGRSVSEIYKIRREAARADRELGPHGRELSYLGRLVRDRLSFPTPTQALEMGGPAEFAPIWTGRNAGILDAEPRFVEGQEVENEWGFGHYDARTHSLFPALFQHLGVRGAWDDLDGVTVDFLRFLEASQSSYGATLRAIETLISDLDDRDRKACVEFLLTDAYYRVATLSGGLKFRMSPRGM